MQMEDMPEKLTLEHLGAVAADAASRWPLRFSAPADLARLAEEGPVPIFAPGSSFAVLSTDDGLVAEALMMTTALSCAREGATVLYVSRRTSLDEFAKRASMGAIRRRGGFDGLSRTDIKRLSSLDIHYWGLREHGESVGAEGFLKAIKASDADLVVLEGGAEGDVLACLTAADVDSVPVLYDQCCTIDAQHVARCDSRVLPNHVLVLDRSLTEEEAELPERPDWGTCECWLLCPDRDRGTMELPFLGTFTLSYAPASCCVGDYVDSYGGHKLYGDLDMVVMEEQAYPVIKPEYYDKKLELLYGQDQAI